MNPLRGLAFDADAIARYTTSIDGPVLLVGHSYGGAVISQAAPAVKDAAGLVFLSAFALDAGESCASVQEPFPPSLLASTSVPSPYDAPGAAGGPDGERFLARRAGAVAESVDGSHAAFIAQPEVAAGLIIKAVAAA